MVPGSTLRYGSSLMRVTLRPRDSRIAAREAAAMPLPSEDTTPPVTKTNLVMSMGMLHPGPRRSCHSGSRRAQGRNAMVVKRDYTGPGQGRRRPGVSIGPDVDDAAPQRDQQRLGAVRGVELGQDALHVRLDCLLADEQPRGDLLVRAAAGELLQDLEFAR